MKFTKQTKEEIDFTFSFCNRVFEIFLNIFFKGFARNHFWWSIFIPLIALLEIGLIVVVILSCKLKNAKKGQVIPKQVTKLYFNCLFFLIFQFLFFTFVVFKVCITCTNKLFKLNLFKLILFI